MPQSRFPPVFCCQNIEERFSTFGSEAWKISHNKWKFWPHYINLLRGSFLWCPTILGVWSYMSVKMPLLWSSMNTFLAIMSHIYTFHYAFRLLKISTDAFHCSKLSMNNFQCPNCLFTSSIHIKTLNF